ncbi:ABC transporter ATP-binding protein [Haladaptatus pallidirubidus]|uniref:ABC-type D-xylose/L-arabinose transporter n=1 Tax=Haladaptatus pallidirubidus TaxID=1008152 RepID=A0AAV3UJB5_9EURY|nr:sn-glycerol-3-phosphate ABC transporter ATP-binding protein UgpC [Haladaptatus pallidirubidus]
MASLTLDRLRKVFSSEGDDGIVAVDDVSIDIEDGEFIVLVGPSGSGKSTILRLLSGLEELSDGEIYVDDTPIGDVKPKNRDVAMVFQNYALYPHLTARKNMSFGLRMRGELSDEEIEQRVDHAATIMGIEELLEKMPNELSGGQQQRVALGRAIVRDPKVFLMDEPLSNLDAKLRTTMRTEIQQLQSELDVTTLYVTHDQTEAMTMGDRIAIMNHGELQQIATPLEAYYEPANVFVAGFIGSPSMNFIRMSASVREDGVVFEHPEFDYETSGTFREEWDAEREDVLVGVRPESIQLAEPDTPDGITVTVTVVEPLGKERLLYFTLGDETYIASVDGRTLVSEGQEITVRFPESQLHVFDPDTGVAVQTPEAPSDGDGEFPSQLNL